MNREGFCFVMDRTTSPILVPRAAVNVDADIAEYQTLLNNGASESAIQSFLQQHVYFFNGIARHHVPIFSHVKFGSEYEADFAFYDPSSYGVEWEFVEIENPSQRMFRQDARPTAGLTHAIEQARDWNTWIRENLEYARRRFPLIAFPLFLCIHWPQPRSYGNDERKTPANKLRQSNVARSQNTRRVRCGSRIRKES